MTEDTAHDKNTMTPLWRQQRKLSLLWHCLHVKAYRGWTYPYFSFVWDTRKLRAKFATSFWLQHWSLYNFHFCVCTNNSRFNHILLIFWPSFPNLCILQNCILNLTVFYHIWIQIFGDIDTDMDKSCLKIFLGSRQDI